MLPENVLNIGKAHQHPWFFGREPVFRENDIVCNIDGGMLNKTRRVVEEDEVTQLKLAGEWSEEFGIHLPRLFDTQGLSLRGRIEKIERRPMAVGVRLVQPRVSIEQRLRSGR